MKAISCSLSPPSRWFCSTNKLLHPLQQTFLSVSLPSSEVMNRSDFRLGSVYQQYTGDGSRIISDCRGLKRVRRWMFSFIGEASLLWRRETKWKLPSAAGFRVYRVTPEFCSDASRESAKPPCDTETSGKHEAGALRHNLQLREF